MATTEGYRIGDVIIAEVNENFSREDLTVLASNTFVIGQIGCLDSAGKVVTVTNAADDIYTITEQAGTDGGAYALRYRGQETALLDYDETAANIQIALRAMHADLDACVVAGSTGGPYTVTIDQSKKSGNFHLSKGADDSAGGGVFEGGVSIDLTTIGERPGVICLDAVESSSDATRTFLVRDAIVDAASLTGSTADVLNRLAEPKVADDYENQAGYGGIFVRTGPTYSTLPVT